MRLITIVQKKLLKQRRFRQILTACTLFAVAFGILIVPIERHDPNSSIHNVSDGLWWSIQTLTTVGYGDVAPVTGAGRLLGAMMQLIGAVMFGSLIALISTSMSRNQEEFYWVRLFERLGRMEEKVTKLEKQISFLVKDEEVYFDPTKETTSVHQSKVRSDDTLG
jgi:voltage-gated potassium channel